MDNESLLAGLVGWATEDALIEPSVFDCNYYTSCDKSIGGTLCRGEGCKMSYVGRQYGSTAIDGGFRLVIVGIDHGEKKGANFDKHRKFVEDYYQRDGDRLGPQYKGVVKIAASVFGRSGAYCLKNCTRSCQKSRDPNAIQCVIDRIVQPNNVKCAPCNTDSPDTQATLIMKTNCTHHLAAELKLLKPNVVVFQGVGARGVVIPILETCGVQTEAIEDVQDNYGPVLYRSTPSGTHFLFLYHPSHGWLDRQWDKVVEPALRYLRNEQVIPTLGFKLTMADDVIQSAADRAGSAEAQLEENRKQGTPVDNVSSLGSAARSARDTIANFDILTNSNGKLHFKHPSLGPGTIAAEDLEKCEFRVVEQRTGAATLYVSVDELLGAGWVSD